MCDVAFALGWDKDCYVHCFGHHNHPGVSEEKMPHLPVLSPWFLAPAGQEQSLARPSTWSGDNGVTKDLGHLLWQLKWHHGGGGKPGDFWLCRRHCSPGWVGVSGDANSQILRKGSLP